MSIYQPIRIKRHAAIMLAATAVIVCIAGGARAQSVLTLPTFVPTKQAALNDALLRSAQHNQWGEVAGLLQQGANPNVTVPNDFFDDVRGRSAFSYAIAWGNINVVRLLLRHGANVNAGNDRGEGPLWDAVMVRQPNIVRLLLHRGAGGFVRKPFGINILRQAWYTGDPDIIRQIEAVRGVPVWQRQIPSELFALGAKTDQPLLVAGTAGAIPMDHLLWASPHKLIVLQNNPKRFVMCDTQTGQVTSLPNLTRRFCRPQSLIKTLSLYLLMARG